MDNVSIFEILMSLPVFNGVSRERIADVAGRIKLHFLKYSDGDQIISSGDPCTHMRFLISGAVKVLISSSDDMIEVEQSINAPSVFALEYMYGRSVVYPFDVYADGQVGILEIAKNDFMAMLNLDQVFMLNFLNIMSTGAQKPVRCAVLSDSIVRRLACCVVAITQRDCERIVLRGKRGTIHEAIGADAKEFDEALSLLKTQGVIDYSDTEIMVLSRAALDAML